MSITPTIRLRLLLVLGGLVLALILIGGTAWTTSLRTAGTLNTLFTDRIVPLADLKVVSDMYAINIVDASHKVANGNIDWEAGRSSVEQASARIAESWRKYTSTYLVGEEVALVKRVKPLMERADTSVKKLDKLLIEKNQEGLRDFIRTELYQEIDPVTEVIGKLVDLQIAVAAAEIERAGTDFSRLRLILISGLGFAIAVSTWAAYSIIFRVSRPLDAITGAMGAVAAGNLALRIPALGQKDEIGRLASALAVFQQTARDKLAGEAAAAEAAETAKRRADADLRQREAQIAAEVEAVVGAAGDGILDRRIALEGKEGTLRAMCQSVNTLVDRTQTALNAVAHVMQLLAAGDLRQSVEGRFGGLFGDLQQAVNGTIGRLSDTVQEIAGSADGVAATAAELSAGTRDLAERSERQASALEETAASMEQLSATVRHNAENASTCGSLSGETLKVAGDGAAVAGQAVDAMARIARSADEIGQIVALIDEIAFQTNLLALNAAVEAARAGEAGRGFAVVAGEVRSLARRSADSSKQIRQLINTATGEIQSGVVLVNAAGDKLREIVSAVSKVAAVVDDIATASREQASGIDQINAAITELDKITQQNAALVEESTAASSSLAEKAQDLKAAINFFRAA